MSLKTVCVDGPCAGEAITSQYDWFSAAITTKLPFLGVADEIPTAVMPEIVTYTIYSISFEALSQMDNNPMIVLIKERAYRHIEKHMIYVWATSLTGFKRALLPVMYTQIPLDYDGLRM